MSTDRRFDSNDLISEATTGTSFVLFGTILGMFLEYGTRVFTARFLVPSEYGLINLGRSILMVTSILSLLGLHSGVPRYIAFYSAKNELSNVKGTIISGLKLVIPISCICAVLIFILRHRIAVDIFKKPELETIMAIFALSLPFSVSSEFFHASLRGFKKAKYAVLSKEIFSRGATFLFMVFFLLGLKLVGAALAYSFGFIVFALTAFYYLNFQTFHFLKPTTTSVNITRKLFLFCWPLIFSFVILQIQFRADTILLGYFRTAEEVGIYNAALPISQFLLIGLNSFLFMLVPLLSELYAKSKYEELKSFYSAVNKWVFFLTSIPFLLFFFFPKPFLDILFGKNYLSAATPLRILALACFIDSTFGLSSAVLLTMEKTKQYLLADAIGFCVSIALNFLLIPTLGADGAAYATMASVIVINITCLAFVYYYTKIHPFSISYLKFFVPSVLLVCFLRLGFYSYFSTSPIFIFLIASLLLIFSFFSLIILRGVEKEDIELLLIIEGKLGRNLSFLRKIIALGMPKS